MWPRFFLIESNCKIAFETMQSNGQTLERFNLVAYTGGKVDLGLRYPVIFDLASTSPAKSVPLLSDHNPQIIVGHAADIAITNSINAVGIMSGSHPKKTEIVANAKNQFPWQLSVGMESYQLDYLEEGKTENVNGQKIDDPVYIARKNVLREISFLSLGADANTLATLLVASFYKGAQMNFEDWVKSLNFDPATLTPEQLAALQGIYDEYIAAPEGATPPANQPTPENVAAAAKLAKRIMAKLPKRAVTNPVPVPTPVNANLPSHDDYIKSLRDKTVAENERIDSIKKLEAQYKNPTSSDGKYISNTAISQGWTVEKTHLEMLQAARPNNVQFIFNKDEPGTMQVLEAALCQHGRIKNLDKKFTPQILDAAHKRYKGRIGLQQFLIEAAHTHGYTGPQNIKANLRAILQAAFSTFDISNILANVTNIALLEGYMNVDQSWREISDVTSASDFKEFSSYRAIGGFTFEKIAPDGKIPHGGLTEQNYGNKIDTYAKMFAITRQDIYNDDLGALTNLPKQIGRGGAIGLNLAFWTEFMNNATFFAAGNNNVTTGALSVAGLSTANAKFRKLKDPQGNYIQSNPAILLVPTELEPTALSLYNDTNLIGATTLQTDQNPWVRKFKPVTSPYLSDSTITGNSTTAYYLLADPADVPTIQVAFLDGIETPTVETADVDFNQLGIQTRGYWDWGVRKQDPNGGVRSTGV